MTLNDFLLSPIPEVVNIAKKLNDLREKYIAGLIDESELLELSEDLVRIDETRRDMISMEAYHEIVQLGEFVKNVKVFMNLI